MNNKKFMADGEANQWLKRNIKIIEDRDHNPIAELLIDWLKPFEKQIEDVLEIGCGSGHNINHIAESLTANGFAIDPSTEAVAYINDNFPNIEALVGFGDDVPLTRKFDLVILGSFLYLVDRQYYLRCVSEADRMVEIGGFLSVIDFEPPFPYSKTYTHQNGMFSHKCNNSDVFVATGLYSVVNKFHFSHNNFFFDKDIDERLSVTLLYKEKTIFEGC